MKGRDHFTKAEAAQVKGLLQRVRKAEPGTPQKLLRDQLRRLGFYISDWAGGPGGFTASDFDDLVQRGSITIAGGAPARHRQEPPRAPPSPARGTAPAADRVDPWGSTTPALAALGGAPLAIKNAIDGGVPDRPGLYAIYGAAPAWSTLGLGKPPDDRPLYVGKAEESLVSRDLNTHFATGATGRSSPRRSLAALLSAARMLDLVAMPRRPQDPEPTKWAHYALEAAGDEQLTRWMHTHLRITVWAAPTGTALRLVESSAMRHWLPPLNLTGVSTTWTQQVKAARAAMAEQARQWARAHGFAA